MHCRRIVADTPSRPSDDQPGRLAGATGCGGGGADGFGGTNGPVVQPAAATSAQAIIARTTGDSVMWVIYLEAAVAVTLVLLIVWWTMRGKK
jgi:hypothetical protein